MPGSGPGRALVSVAIVLVSYSHSFAQPYGWSILHPQASPVSAPSMVQVKNLASGETVSTLPIPSGITATSGVHSPDGDYYFISSSVGIARINARTRQLDAVFGPALAGSL